MIEEKYTQGFTEELDWDSVISEEYNLLPEGEYPFTIIRLEKGSYLPGPGSKIPSCNMATVVCLITAPDGKTTMCNARLYLTKKMEWKLSEFFTCIGLRKRGEQMKMSWDRVEGSEGRLRLGIRKGSNGSDDYNEIKKFIAPVEW